MGKRGPKPKGKVKIKWSPDFAYAVGLIATDGCLYRHKECVNLTSKDLEIIKNFQKALHLKNRYKIGRKSRGLDPDDKKYFVIQVSDASLYNFLKGIGITPAKSKTLGPVNVPDVFLSDFLRGIFDGDGYTYSYWDPRWKSSFMYYVGFVSASLAFITWLRNKIFRSVGVKGHVTTAKRKNTYYQLKYAKADGIKIIRKMYYQKNVLYLTRKYLKIRKMLDIVGERL